MERSPRAGYGLSAGAAIVWASTAPGLAYLISRYDVPGLTLALWRDVFVAVACLVGVLALQPALLRVSGGQLRSLALTGVVSIGIYHSFWLWSVQLNGAAVAVVLIYTYPTFVTIGAWLLFREPISRAHVAALALALAGCALVVRAYDPAVLRVSWLGALVGLMTALTHTVYVLVGQRSAATVSPWTTLTYTMASGSLTLLLIVLVADAVAPGARPLLWGVGDDAGAWLILAFIAIGPTLGGYALFTMALRHIPGRVAGLISVIEAPIATLIAVVLVGERLEWPQVAGMALILGAILLPRTVARLRRPALPAEGPGVVAEGSRRA